jgi:endonuclease/exonuclease/phosphatase (EEP) superfamily protein YafD
MRRLLLATIAAGVAGLAVLHVLLLLGVSRPVPLDWLWSFVPHLFLPAWLLLVLALVAGSRVLVVGAAVVAAAHLAWLLPVTTGDAESAPAGAIELRVVSSNVLHDNPRLDDNLAEVLAADADLVVLQEVTLRDQPTIFDALSPSYPSYTFMARDDAFGAAVFSRHPLVDEQILDVAGLPMLTIGVDLGPVTVRVWNVHTRAPTLTGRRLLRDAQLSVMADLRRFEHQPLVAAGDFNATYWHDELADLLATDLRDAHAVVGLGLTGTWKSARVEVLIDHVLLSPEWGVAAVRNGEGPGSDHRPVIADLFLRPEVRTRRRPRRAPG